MDFARTEKLWGVEDKMLNLATIASIILFTMVFILPYLSRPTGGATKESSYEPGKVENLHIADLPLYEPLPLEAITPEASSKPSAPSEGVNSAESRPLTSEATSQRRRDVVNSPAQQPKSLIDSTVSSLRKTTGSLLSGVR